MELLMWTAGHTTRSIQLFTQNPVEETRLQLQPGIHTCQAYT